MIILSTNLLLPDALQYPSLDLETTISLWLGKPDDTSVSVEQKAILLV